MIVDWLKLMLVCWLKMHSKYHYWWLVVVELPRSYVVYGRCFGLSFWKVEGKCTHIQLDTVLTHRVVGTEHQKTWKMRRFQIEITAGGLLVKTIGSTVMAIFKFYQWSLAIGGSGRGWAPSEQ